MLSVDNVGKTQNGCELEEKKISEGLGGSVHETESKAASSIEAVESTSKTVVVTEAKEKEKLVPFGDFEEEARSTIARTT